MKQSCSQINVFEEPRTTSNHLEPPRNDSLMTVDISSSGSTVQSELMWSPGRSLANSCFRWSLRLGSGQAEPQAEPQSQAVNTEVQIVIKRQHKHHPHTQPLCAFPDGAVLQADARRWSRTDASGAGGGDGAKQHQVAQQ